MSVRAEGEEVFEVRGDAADNQGRPDEVPALAKRYDGGNVRWSERHLSALSQRRESYIFDFRFSIFDCKAGDRSHCLRYSLAAAGGRWLLI